MTLENPLETLDEIILAQHEKVTQWAHKKYGWNKYDLARIADAAGSFAAFGAGVYSSIASALLKVPLLFGGGMSMIVSGYSQYHLAKRVNDEKEKFETARIVNTGAGHKPSPSSLRPLLFIPTAIYYNLALSLLSDDHDFAKAGGLLFFCVGNWILGSTAASYFRDTTLTPPATKKNPLKQLYHAVMDYLAPTPSLEPIKLPQSHYTPELTLP